MNKRTESEKRQWSKPELIVLLRGKPEEAVLLACKRQNYVISGSARQPCGRTGRPCVNQQRVTS